MSSCNRKWWYASLISMLVPKVTLRSAFFKIAKFSNFTLANVKKLFKKRRSMMRRKLPLLFGTKKHLERYYCDFTGGEISTIAPEDT